MSNEIEQVYPPEQANSIVSDYVCAGCWGRLNIRHLTDSHNVVVFCSNCGDNRGLHYHTWTENERQLNQTYAIEAKKTLRDLGIIPNPHEGKSADQLIKELGF